MKRPLFYSALAAGLLGFSMTASANFIGYYAPGNWRVGNTLYDSGIVDTTSAPGSSITLIGSDNSSGEFSRVDFSIVAPVAGTFSFDWAFSSTDTLGAGYETAGYLKNGQPQLYPNDLGNILSGRKSVPVTAGDVFGFYVITQDNLGGSASLTISDFSAPVPEPASVAMMALGLLGLVGVASARRRRLP